MNSLGRKILRVLEETPLEGMSIHILSKQCLDAGFCFDTISNTDVPMLVEKLREVLPYFMPANTAKSAVTAIEALADTKRVS